MNEALHAGGRGAVAAMAMSGMRMFTYHAGLVDETPPIAIVKQKAKGPMRLVPKNRRPAVVELAHWGYGAGGGAAFGLLPDRVRRAPWAGPVYGLAVWIGFEVGVAPLLGLRQARRMPATTRAALIVDHLLYGLVLNEGRRRPQT